LNNCRVYKHTPQISRLFYPLGGNGKTKSAGITKPLRI